MVATAAVNTSFRTIEMPRSPVHLGGNLPWASVGVRLANAKTAEQALEAAGLLWDVHMKRILVDLGTPEHPHLVEFPDKRALIRDHVKGTTEASRFFGTASDHFQILQNKDAFTFFDQIIQKKEAVYHAAGSLLGGRIVFLVAKLPEDLAVTDSDLVGQFVLIVNGHNGQQRLRMSYLPVSYQTGAVLRSALPTKYNVAIRHIGTNFSGKVAEARRELGILPQWSRNAATAFQHLATRQLTDADVDRYLASVFPDREDDRAPAAHRDQVKALIALAPRRDTRPSAWEIYQATATEIDTGGKQTKPAARLSSIWFGARAAAKERAFHHIVKISA